MDIVIFHKFKPFSVDNRILNTMLWMTWANEGGDHQGAIQMIRWLHATDTSTYTTFYRLVIIHCNNFYWKTCVAYLLNNYFKFRIYLIVYMISY